MRYILIIAFLMLLMPAADKLISHLIKCPKMYKLAAQILPLPDWDDIDA